MTCVHTNEASNVDIIKSDDRSNVQKIEHVLKFNVHFYVLIIHTKVIYLPK